MSANARPTTRSSCRRSDRIVAIGLALGLLVLANCGGGSEAENLSTATTRDNSVSPTTAQGLLPGFLHSLVIAGTGSPHC